MNLFTKADYDALAAIVFQPDYPGFASARGVVEAPNGNPNARDAQKRYSHVADKYLDQLPYGWHGNAVQVLDEYLYTAFIHACQVAHTLGVPSEFWPRLEFGALRVLEYPAGVGGHAHTDPALFALNLYRNVPNLGLGVGEYHMGEIGELIGLGAAESHHIDPFLMPQRSIVYFAIPDHAAVLPSGQTVGAWLTERMSRSRYQRG